MDYRLNDLCYDLAELLQANKQGLRFKELVDCSEANAKEVYEALEKLRKWNHITLLDKDYAFYTITNNNEALEIFKVKCPHCGTIKRVHDKKQARVVCNGCTFPGGKQRQFEIISRELLKRGIIKPINHN